MSIKTRPYSVRIFIASIYFYLILLIGGLIGQFHLDTQVARILMGGFLIISVAVLMLNKQLLIGDFLKKWPFIFLLLFAIYASCFALKYYYWLSIVYAISLVVVFYILGICLYSLTGSEQINLKRLLGFAIAIYAAMNVIAVVFFPSHVFSPLPSVIGEVYHPFIGLIGTPNSSADVLYVCLLILGYGFFSSKQALEKVFFVSIMLVTAFFLLISESRSAIFSILFVILLQAGYMLFRKIIIAFLILAVVIFVLAMIFIIGMQHNSMHLFAANLSGRNNIWSSVLIYMFQQKHYLWGVGLERQNIIIQLCHFPYEKMHNSFLDIFVGTGFIGLTLFLLFIGGIYFSVVRCYLANKNNLTFFLFLGVTALILHSMVESYLISQLSPDYFCLILFYCLSLSAKRISQ